MRTPILVGAAALLFAVACGALVLAIVWRNHDVNARLRQQRKTDLALCRSASQNRLVLRRILLLARNEVVHTPGLTPDQRRRSMRFYSRTLRIAAPIACPSH